MMPASRCRAAAAALIVTSALAAGAMTAAHARPGIDTTHRGADRRSADACIVRAIIIYTDPYIGGRLSNREVVAAVARMCARPLRRYSEDLGLETFAARRLLRNTIEAGLRDQLHGSAGRLLPHDTR